ncbi:MAG: NmrA family NAD(P)-binding protein [Chloroflexi bacterium]|nr:NmrA family NAD(P)-binding protein [Chloroflexota bacterium]
MSENKDGNAGVTLIVGGTGKTGRRVAQRLTARGLPVRIGSRSGEPPFDWEDATTWAPAVRGVESAYVTYYPDLGFAGAAEKVRSFARTAVENGVHRLVLLSGRNEAGALLGEQAVQESGAEWTLVRASMFAQNFSEYFLLEGVLAGEVALPAGDVKEPFIDIDDLADVVVAALTGPGHTDRLYEVTGPRLLTFAEAVAEISQATGREIRYVPVSPEDYLSGMIAGGVPADFAKDLTDLFSEVLDGRSSYLSDGVKRALGREPKDFSDFAQETAASAVWGPAADRVGAVSGSQNNG